MTARQPRPQKPSPRREYGPPSRTTGKRAVKVVKPKSPTLPRPPEPKRAKPGAQPSKAPKRVSTVDSQGRRRNVTKPPPKPPPPYKIPKSTPGSLQVPRQKPGTVGLAPGQRKAPKRQVPKRKGSK